MALDRDQLIKLLNLTGSEYDAEALSTIRRSNTLLRKHRVTWADLLALPQEPAQALKPSQAQPKRPPPRPSPRDFDPSRHKPIWKPPKVRPGTWQKNWQTVRPSSRSVLPVLRFLFFPITVFAWLYVRVVRTAHGRLKPVAILVPIFGAAAAATIWALVLLSVALALISALQR
jgi:hypothetical protein